MMGKEDDPFLLVYGIFSGDILNFQGVMQGLPKKTVVGWSYGTPYYSIGFFSPQLPLRLFLDMSRLFRIHLSLDGRFLGDS